MSDGEHIAALVQIASDGKALQRAEHAATRKLLAFDREIYPADGCAITQSCLLQAAGIDVPNTFQALAFGNLLQSRGWQRISVGQQQAGDVGSTCKAAPNHGSDHVYLVLRRVNGDEMVIADNQAKQPHFRCASGKDGKTPTTHFLRAPAPAPVTAMAAPPFVQPPLVQMDNSLMGDVNMVKSVFKSKIAWLSGGLGGTSVASAINSNPDLVSLLKSIAVTPAFWVAVAAIGISALVIYYRWRDHGRGNHV